MIVAPALERYGDFAAFLGGGDDDPAIFRQLRRSETTGRPLGSSAWLESLEKMTGKRLQPQKRGPKGKTGSDN